VPNRETSHTPRRFPLRWAVAAALLAAFVALAVCSRKVPALAEWDRHVTDSFIAWRSAGWNRAFWVFTLLGDDPLMATLSTALVVLLLTWGRRARAAAFAAGLTAGWAVMHVGKAAAGRARPPAVDALVQTPGSHSMPSGHALISVVFCGLLVCLAFAWAERGAARRGGRRAGVTVEAAASLAGAAVKGAALLAGSGVAALVGLSRVYLGVHWLSDVIAGWCLGGAVLIAALWFTERWRGSRGPRGALADAPPWRGRRTRAVVVAATVAVVCAVAAVTAWADPLY
jgi:membrane-associated phospholipid phosphatase